jgi:hypothetical protein
MSQAAAVVPVSSARGRTLISHGDRAQPGLALNEHIEADGATVFDHVRRMGLEGIVSKRLDASYRSGRTGDWIKTRTARPLTNRARCRPARIVRLDWCDPCQSKRRTRELRCGKVATMRPSRATASETKESPT